MTQQLHLGPFTPRNPVCRLHKIHFWPAAVDVVDVLNGTFQQLPLTLGHGGTSARGE